MKGKDKCRMLKQIRKKIADENDIPYVVEECPYQGDCKGTCPKCEAELREMERQLSLRRKIGKTVAIAGIATGIMASTVACTAEDVENFIQDVLGIERLDGDVSVEGMMQYDPPATLSGDVAYPSGWEEGDVTYSPDEEAKKDICDGDDCTLKNDSSNGLQ